MRSPVVAARASMLARSHLPSAGAGPAVPQAPSGRPVNGLPGLRTDRLSQLHLRQWQHIVEIVMAQGRDGQSLHPTLRYLWDAVVSSPHAVYVEMPGPMCCYTGRFEVTRVDPSGESHEAVLLLSLRAIDVAPTGRAVVRADGFIPFRGLDRIARYAEALGHELAHAVWHLADPERARLALRLDDRMERQAKVLAAVGGFHERAEIQQNLEDLARQAIALEEPAQAAEMAIRAELRASRRRRSTPMVSAHSRSAPR